VFYLTLPPLLVSFHLFSDVHYLNQECNGNRKAAETSVAQICEALADVKHSHFDVHYSRWDTNEGGFGMAAQVALVRAVGSSDFLGHSDQFVVRCICCSNFWDMRM
jgi:hypothetical protein